MKNTEKIARNEHYEYLYTCRCGSYTHQLIFSFWKDIAKQAIKEGDDIDCFLSFVVEPKGIWKRIKIAFGVLFRKRDVFVQEIMLSEKDLKELKQGLNKALRLINKLTL